MATNCRRRKREGTSNPFNFVGEAPKFFKIVVNPRDNRLRLPTEFVKRYGQSLPNRVFLNVPNGSVQQVELIQINGETWLQRGWQEFKEKYSIDFGHVLLFEYDCSFDFNVYIFDMTALEIEYPLDSAYNEGINREKAVGLMLNTENNPESETDNSVVFLGKRLANLCEKGKRKNLLQADMTENDVSVEILDSPLERLDKRRTRSKTDDSVEFSDDPSVRKSSSGMQNLLSHSKYLRVGGSSPSPNYQSEHTRVKLEGSGGQATKRARRVLNKETCISYQRAKAFKSDNPSQNPFCISVMLPSAVNSSCLLFIPFPFARENLPRTRNNIKLSVCDGKTWPVRCIVRLGTAKISAGWPGFVKSNALKVGDTCIFEVNKSNKLVWNVIIFHC